MSTNGILELLANDYNATGTSSPPGTPFPTDGVLIAPYWADADTRGTGRVYYRCTTDQVELLLHIQFYTEAFFPGSRFIADYLCIITWFEVGYFNSRTDKVNHSKLHYTWLP